MDWKKKLKFILITSAFAILILIVLSNVVKMTQVSEKDFKTYRQGLEYFNKKDFENAYFNFSNVSKTSAIYEIALLRQAMSADELNDSSTASKKYRMFIEKYPDSIFIQKAYYSLAQNCFREKDYNRAEKEFNDIRKFFKDSEYKIASSYYLGIIYSEKSKEEKDEKNILETKIKAKNYFNEYLKDAPSGRLSLNCIDSILALNIPLNQNDYYNIAVSYYKNGLIKHAYDYFNKAYMSASWGYLSLIYKKQGNYNKSREIFEYNYPQYGKNLDDDTLHAVIENYALIYPQGAKSGWYRVLELSEPEKAKGADYALYRLTKLENEQIRNNLYERIYTQYPSGKYAPDALSNLFWYAYQNRQYKKAFYLGQIHMKNYPNTISAPFVMFWTAKLCEKTGNRNEAKGLYQKIITKYPDDYYAYRASKHTNYTQNPNWDTKSSHRLPEKKQIIQFPFNHTGIPEDNIKLINTIIKLNDYKLLGEIDRENKAVQSWINYKERKYSTAAALARDAIAEYEQKPDFSDSIYKLAYQLHYQEIINENAKMFILDPYLITALIREESYFNPDAQSAAGARGLMQLMPSTAAYIAGKNNINYQGKSTLFNPEKNIKLGSAYLDYAKTKLQENDLLAVASYNGGPNAVRNWKNNLTYKNFDEFVEHIPYPETREYVKKVYRSYWVYLNIYK